MTNLNQDGETEMIVFIIIIDDYHDDDEQSI